VSTGIFDARGGQAIKRRRNEPAGAGKGFQAIFQSSMISPDIVD